MDVLIKLNNKTSGRDNLARLIQYSSRTLWYVLQQYHLSNRKSVDKFKSLEYTFSSFRKLLRFGRFLDNFYKALKSINYPDPILCYTCTISNISNAMFLFCDHILWLGSAGLMQINSQKWSNLSHKYWLYSIILNLVNDYYQLRQLLANKFVDMNFLLRNHKFLVADTLKNICNIFIPLSALGIVKFNAGFVGLFGILSSIAGIVSLINSSL